MRSLIFSALFLLPILLIGQIQPDSELNLKLEGKQKFSEIKQTVLDHYNAKLSLLSASDTLARKKYMRQLKMWNRQFWISECYTNAEGIVQNPNEINEKGLEEMGRMKSKVTIRHQPSNWNLQGPYWSDKGVGRFDKIAFHPTDPNIIFAGSPHGGLFKTLDGGNNWFSISAFLPSLGISGIAIHPTNPNIIYVLTGEANTGGYFGNSYISFSEGVFKSTDGGNSWQKTGQIDTGNYQGYDLIINPSNPEILIAATSNGLFRTDNGGVSWEQEIFGATCWDVEFKPGDPNMVYAVTSTQFFRSNNGGNNFTIINTGTLLNAADRISIGVTAANSSKVLLFCGPGINNSSFHGLIQSTDSGSNNSFSLLANTPNLFYDFTGTPSQQAATNTGSGQSGYNNCIAISPTNENEIYTGGLCVWKSTDGGINWTQISAYWPSGSPYMHPDTHWLAINPLNSKLFCANDGGIYLFESSAWSTKYNGLSTSQFYHFERENDEGDIWGGCQDNGMQEQNGGGSYFNYNFGDGYDEMTDHDYLVEDGDDDDVYFSVNNSIYKDFAGTKTEISIPNNNSFFANLAMSPEEEDKIYAGYNTGLWRSLDAGDNWATVSNQPANWCVSTTKHNDVVYFAGDNGLFRWVTGNAAVNRNPPAPYNTNLKITDIDVDRLNENNLYVSVAGNEENAKVFCSTNGGISWTNLTLNLPDVPIFCIKLDANNGLYVGTSIGMFYKPAGLGHWQPFSNGLPPTPVTEIELWPEPHPTNGNPPANPPATPEIWISTFGRGIWLTQQYTSNCENNLPLAGVLRGLNYKESISTITSTQELLGGEGTIVKYNTGNKITLTDGFRAWYGSNFKTYLTGCGGVVD